MKKILIIANNDIGMYHFRKELLEALIKKPYEVHIALPYGSFVENMKDMGCVFHETKMERRGKNPFQELKLINCYQRILKKIKPDVVLTYTIKPNLYGGMLCAWKKIPYITNITGLGTAVEGNGLLQKITICLYRFAMRKVNVLFFQNETNEKYMTDKKIALGKHKIIPGSGVNLERFQFLEFPNSEQVEFLFISRVMKEKGIDQYIQMATHIKKKYPNTVFHILGFCEDDDEKPDSYKKRLETLQQQEVVVFHGMQPEIDEFLKKSQCTIHPSFYPEGMSNVCLESAASGRPVITTKRAGCKETIEDGVTGFLVEEQNAEQLILRVEAFLKMTLEQRKEMGIRARKKMEQQFDRNIVVKAYLDEIQKIAENYHMMYN